MYLKFYGLKKEPFHTTPDPNFLYLSPTHKEALGAIIYGIEQRKGFIAITGEVGVGKTTIIRSYLERPTTRKQKTIYIFNPVVSFHALLSTIFRSLDVSLKNDDLSEMVNQLHEILVEEYRTNSTVVLVIDEAQNMPKETLENLRMLSNLETVADKLIQIVLIGQPELNALLDHPNLRALKQRIALRATICPLTPKESEAYIEHRVTLASHTGLPLFTQDAIKLLARQAEGIPRRLNILCDNALITGYGRQRNPVTVSEVKEILADWDSKEPSSFSKWSLAATVALVLAIGSFFLGVFFLLNNFSAFQNPILNKNRSFEDGSIKKVEPYNRVSEQSSDLIEAQVVRSSPEPIKKVHEGRSFVQSEALDDISLPSTVYNNIERSEVEKSRPSVPDDGKMLVDGNSLDFKGHNTEKTMKNVLEATPLPLENEYLNGKKGINEKEIGETQPVIKDSTKSFTKIRLVKKGESLSKITEENYGSNDPKYVNWVQHHNSQIVNPDIILPGQQIVLPEYVQE